MEALTEERIGEIARAAAREAVGEAQVKGELLFHIAEHEAVGHGLVIDPARARATPCTCFTVEEDGFESCWSPGVLGLITSKKNPEQIAEFCAKGKVYGGAGAKERFLKVRDAIKKAHEQWEKKGGGLPGWWQEVGKSMKEHSIEL